MPPSPANPPPAPSASAAACDNCGAVLVGPYCHACGQSAERPETSVRGFLRHAAADLTSLDSRFLRTLALLLARPGRLTREYLDGRRVRYTQPLSLYLAAAAVFFFVNAYRPFLSFDVERRRVTSSLSGARLTGGLDEHSMAHLAARGISLEVFKERFEATVTGYLPALLVGSVLLFGLVLHLFHRRQRRGYLEHAVFALHWSAFYLLLLIVERLLPQGAGGLRAPDVMLAVLSAVYLALALRRVYGQSWPVTGIKALSLLFLYQVLLLAWMATAMAISFPLLL
jgi:Protein of unknown function (DUF3667)